VPRTQLLNCGERARPTHRSWAQAATMLTSSQLWICERGTYPIFLRVIGRKRLRCDAREPFWRLYKDHKFIRDGRVSSVKSPPGHLDSRHKGFPLHAVQVCLY